MAALVPQIASGSTNGLAVLVVATSTLGTVLHTCVTGTDDMDEVYVWAYNDHTADLLLTIEWGGVTTPKDTIRYTVPFDDGLHLIIPGIRMNNAKVVTAFTTTTNVITCLINVNRLLKTG